MEANETAEISADKYVPYGNATIKGVPDKRFLDVMTSKAVRETVYSVETNIHGIPLEIEVFGSGCMRAYVSGPYVIIHNGLVNLETGRRPICWADTGKQAVIKTDLDHKHLRLGVKPDTIIQKFIGSMTLIKSACGPFGYEQWLAASRLYIQRIADQMDTQLEVVFDMPLPMDMTCDNCPKDQRPTYRVTDVGSRKAQMPTLPLMPGLDEIIADKRPAATNLCLQMTGTIHRRPHREIITSQ